MTFAMSAAIGQRAQFRAIRRTGTARTSIKTWNEVQRSAVKRPLTRRPGNRGSGWKRICQAISRFFPPELPGQHCRAVAPGKITPQSRGKA